MGEGDHCCGFRESTCVGVWQVTAVVFIIITLVIVAVNVGLVAARDARHRACGIATGSEVALATGVAGAEPNARYVYRVVFDGDSNSIYFRLRWNTTGTSAPTAVHLRGPMSAETLTGPLAGSLCGAPHAVACDPQMGSVEGRLVVTLHNGVAPHGVDIRTVAEPFRAEPELYYLEVLSTAAPTTPGAARSQLTSQCGYE